MNSLAWKPTQIIEYRLEIGLIFMEFLIQVNKLQIFSKERRNKPWDINDQGS